MSRNYSKRIKTDSKLIKVSLNYNNFYPKFKNKGIGEYKEAIPLSKDKVNATHLLVNTKKALTAYEICSVLREYIPKDTF
ncbi:MAG: hypothetical protein ACRDDF_03410, partial [Aeromonas sp.]